MTNRITITGHLGADAELRFTDSGRPVLNFSVGDGKSRRGEGGDWVEVRPTIWHRVAVWGPLAEMWANSGLLVKGAHVDVTGELEIREFEYQGESRWSADVTAYQVGVREPRQGGGFQQQQQGDPWGGQQSQGQDWPGAAQPGTGQPPF